MSSSLTVEKIPTEEPRQESKQKAVMPCSKCDRREVCRDFNTCRDCKKSALRATLDKKIQAPSLKVFALRVDDILPIEPAFVAVDSSGIKFFTCRPFFKYDKSDKYNKNIGYWTTNCHADQIACLKYDYLEGIFDTSHYKISDRFNKDKILYNFEQMISPL